MKRLLPLLLAAILCFTAVSCEESGKSPSASAPEETSQSSASSDTAEPEPQSDAPAVVLSDADRSRLRALIDDHRYPPHDKPAWSLARPSGIDFYYDYDGGFRLRAHLPDEYTPELNQPHSFYVSLEVTVAALGPSDKTDGLTLLVSHDKGQTWEEVKPPVEDVERYRYYYIAFQDENNGLLILSDEETSITYSTVDGGREWTLSGSFATPEIFYKLHTANGQYLIIGKNNGEPIVSKSADGVHWEEKVLPLDRERYTRGDTVFVSFDDNIGLAVVNAATIKDDIHLLCYGSNDYGENWVLFTSL